MPTACVFAPTASINGGTKGQKRQNLNYNLLEEMAKNLGYKDRITWETIQNPYVPKGMIDQWEAQARSQQAYNDLLHSMTSIMPKKESKEVTK